MNAAVALVTLEVLACFHGAARICVTLRVRGGRGLYLLTDLERGDAWPFQLGDDAPLELAVALPRHGRPFAVVEVQDALGRRVAHRVVGAPEVRGLEAEAKPGTVRVLEPGVHEVFESVSTGHLVVLPGARVRLYPRASVVVRDGVLWSLGTAERPVRWIAGDEDGWGHLSVEQGRGTSVLRHTEVSGGRGDVVDAGATRGGGLHVGQARAELTRVTFEGCRAGLGGGLSVTGGAAALCDVDFRDCVAEAGGAMALARAGGTSVVGGTWSGCVATRRGGGVWAWESDELSFKGVEMDGLEAEGAAVGSFHGCEAVWERCGWTADHPFHVEDGGLALKRCVSAVGSSQVRGRIRQLAVRRKE